MEGTQVCEQSNKVLSDEAGASVESAITSNAFNIQGRAWPLLFSEIHVEAAHPSEDGAMGTQHRLGPLVILGGRHMRTSVLSDNRLPPWTSCPPHPGWPQMCIMARIHI